MVGLACALVLTATGCVGAPPAETPSPSFTGFATEDEAFAAAEAVYERYIESGNMAREGRVDADPTSYLTGAALDEELSGQRRLTSEGLTLSGPTLFVGYDAISSVDGVVDILVCHDQSQVRVLDASGNDVTPDGRSDTAAYEVTLRSEDGALKIASLEGVATC